MSQLREKIVSEGGFLFMKRMKIFREGTDQIYLDRLILIRCRFGSIMFHRIYLTDNDCMHDHPWLFHTILLKGTYLEHFNTCPECIGPKWYEGKQWIKPWRLQYRPANWVHRLEIPEGKSVWSLVFTSTKKRSWGFWTPKGWTPWRNYANVGSCE